jgi:hypothetical protein
MRDHAAVVVSLPRYEVILVSFVAPVPAARRHRLSGMNA